jgi:NADH dehydrogenase [ubiquinone] 1 alpha subcomplex assembly factor 7
MKYTPENFDFKTNKLIPVDKFIEKILYKPDIGYYAKKIPFGRKGDFVTAPTISNLFSEIVTIWLISCWEKLGRPKNFNIVELGPGEGSFAKVLADTIKNFPEFDKSTKIYLYEKSEFLKKIQSMKVSNSKVKWIKNFKSIKKGPIIFFGNEFFDAIPIKQYAFFKNNLYEKCYVFNQKNGLDETYRKASLNELSKIKSFKTLKNVKFIEYPKKGFKELDKIIHKITELGGGIMLIDYGYINALNKSTLQTVMKNKKIDIDNLFKNLGSADVTYLVNFSLLKEYFLKKKLKVSNVVSQKFFLEKMGIIQRAKILEKRMTQKQKEYMSSTLIRLLHKNLMGDLFKVIFAFKHKNNNFLGFN